MDSIDLRPDPLIDVKDIMSTATGQEVSVTVKVIETSEPEIVKIKREEAGAPKQDILVVDTTDACTVALWKDCQSVFRFLTCVNALLRDCFRA